MVTKLPHNTATPDIETASDAYRQRFAGKIGAYLLTQQEKAIHKVLPLADTSSDIALDVGGGHGQLAPILKTLGYNVFVQGSSEICAAQLARASDDATSKTDLVVSDLWSLPFRDASVDLVTAVRLLAHVSHWQELLTEMARITKQYLLVDYASLTALNGLTPLVFGWKKRVEGNTRPYFSYTNKQIVQHLRTLGFTKFRTAKQFLLPMGLHRALSIPICSQLMEGTCQTLGLTAAFGSPVILLAQKERTS